MRRRRAATSSPWRRWVVRPWRVHVARPLAELEAESHRATAERGSAFDWQAAVVCLVVAVNLTLLYYFGLSNHLGWLPGALRWLGLDGLAASFEASVMLGTNARFYGLLYWVASCVVLYFLVPALVVKLVFRQSLSEYGLGLRGALGHLKLYVALFLIVLPLVVIVSYDEQFQQQYPFYKDTVPNRVPPHFALWQVAYAMQFFALEFFFRGFMVHGLKRRLGVYAIFVMMVPYCMIHFGKPFPETLGAVVAGVVLGFLSLRTGTIWLGFLIHVSVALSMDLAALWQKGLL
jgi:uncharacterized protein